MRAQVELSQLIRRIEFTETVKRRLIDDMKEAVESVRTVQREVETLERQLNPKTKKLKLKPSGGSKSLISLDQLQFYTSKVGSQTTSNVGSLGTLRYTFSSGDSVILDASRNHGSGSGDMYAYIPTSDFAGSKTSDFVYLYAHFGNTDASQAGFEEWALVNAAPIPEINALFPIIGFFALAFATQHLRRRHARQLGDI